MTAMVSLPWTRRVPSSGAPRKRPGICVRRGCDERATALPRLTLYLADPDSTRIEVETGSLEACLVHQSEITAGHAISRMTWSWIEETFGSVDRTQADIRWVPIQ